MSKLEFNYLSWWVGGSEKNEINAILNLVEVKVEVGVELGKNMFINIFLNNIIYCNTSITKHCFVRVHDIH